MINESSVPEFLKKNPEKCVIGLTLELTRLTEVRKIG